METAHPCVPDMDIDFSEIRPFGPDHYSRIRPNAKPKYNPQRYYETRRWQFTVAVERLDRFVAHIWSYPIPEPKSDDPNPPPPLAHGYVVIHARELAPDERLALAELKADERRLRIRQLENVELDFGTLKAACQYAREQARCHFQQHLARALAAGMPRPLETPDVDPESDNWIPTHNGSKPPTDTFDPTSPAPGENRL